jgi:trigger factor
MHVSIESTGNLRRRMTVELPSEKIDAEVARRLVAMSKSVRLKGFRPGKAPLNVVKTQFGQRVLQEVLGDLMRSSYKDAIEQEKLRPAGGPSIQPEMGANDRSLKYVAEFEVLPEFEIADLKGLEVRRPQAEVTDADVDKMIESLRKQRVAWEEVQRASETGDEVIVDYEGTVDGLAFSNNSAKDFALELGAGRWLASFEDQLLGLSADERREIDVVYPDSAQPQELAGKTVHFAVHVKTVSKPVLPEVNDGFAAQFGIQEGGVEAFRHEVRANMERELSQRIMTVVQARVMEALLAAHSVEVPLIMVRQEAERLRARMQQTMGQAAAVPSESLEAEAKRRAALGLIVGEIVRRNSISVDPSLLKSRIELLAASYEAPQQVIEYYYSNPQARASAEALTLEQQVVDWVLARATVTEEKSAFEDLVNRSKM